MNWKEELQMFKQMNINKPALAPLYDSLIEEAIIYRLKNDDVKSRIKELKVKLALNGFPEMIGATIVEDNYLYTSEKKLLMLFNSDMRILDSYEIRSKTRVIFMGEDKGVIKAKIK